MLNYYQNKHKSGSSIIVVESQAHNNNNIETTNSVTPAILDLQVSQIITGNNLGSMGTTVDRGRAGFTIAELDQFSKFVPDLALEGFTVPAGTSGRVIQSDTSTAKLARLSNNLPNPNGDGYLRYIQSRDKGVVFKRLVVDPTSNTIYIAESFFKALAIHKAGFNAVCYSGINSIFNDRKLNPEFVELLEGYKHVILTYDIDDTPDKRYFVEKQILRIVSALHKLNKSVSIIDSWDRICAGKDLDEILVKRGLPFLQSILNSSHPLNSWEGFAVKSAYTATHKEDSLYLGEIILDLIEKYRLCFINAPMGAGKSFSLAKVLKGLYPELGALIVSPLIVLGRQICKDLQSKGITITYREDMETSKNWERIVTCLESVKPTSKLQINLDGSQLQDKILIIDEVSAVVDTLLCGNTLSKIRKTVIECLTACLRQAKKVICMGADVTDFECGVIEKLMGDSLASKDICKYQNTFKRNQFKAVITSSTEALAIAHILASAGKRVMLAVDSQKSTSTYSGINLKELVTQHSSKFKLAPVPADKTLVIDSETTKTIGHDAYEIVQKGRKELLYKYDLVICSPSVDKGWSLSADSKFFDIIVVLHMGQSDPDSVCQFTMRDRNTEIPRIIAFAGQERLALGGGETASQIKAAMRESISLIETATNAKKYRKIIADYELNTYYDLGINLNIGSLTLEKEFCTIQAIKNLKLSVREHYVRTKLIAQGAQFYSSLSEILPTDLLDIIENADGCSTLSRSGTLKVIAKETTEAISNREHKAPDYDDKQAESLKDVGALTQVQIDSLNKYYTRKATKYEDICVEDISDYKWGKLQPEALWFYLTQGRQFVSFLESTRIAGLREIPLHNPTALMADDAIQLDQIYSQDIISGALAHRVGLLEKLKLKEAVEYAQKHGVADFFLIGTDEQKLVPTPILECLNLVQEYKKELVSTFSWDWKNFKAKDTLLFERVLDLVGFKYAPEKQIRVTTNKIVRKKRISFEIVTDRKQHLQQKRFAAMSADLIEKENIFINNQLLAKVGRDLIKRVRTEGCFAELLANYRQDILLESARRLPRLAKNGEGFGLSEHFKLLSYINNYQPKLEAKIVVVNETNVVTFNVQVSQWITQKKDIGFDTETYESLTHKVFCTVNKNGKYQWLNAYTGRNQTVEPGLDQNHNLVRLIQLSDGVTTYVLDLGKCDGVAVPLWLKDTWHLIQKLTESNTLIGHNAKFDTSSLIKYDVHVRHPYCTMITTKLLFGDCGAGKVLSGGYGLKAVAFHLLGLTIDKEQQKSNWGADNLSESQLVYAAKDAVLPLALHEVLELILENPVKWNLPEMIGTDGKHANLPLIRLENANIYPTTAMQWRGVPVNLPKVKKCITQLQSLVSKVLHEWELLQMPCKPSQAAQVVEEMNRRYYDREHPFTALELIQALGIELVDDCGELLDLEELPEDSLKLPAIDKPLAKSGKDVINDNSELPEFNLLKAYRSYTSAIIQLSKVVISAEINGGRCKTEYQPLSGTGRMSCGNNKGLGTPNLQAFVKKAEGRYFGFSEDPIKKTLNDWWLPSVEEKVPVRNLFELTNYDYAFITEDANASHARLAIGFGKCEFGKQSQVGGIDSHSMFAIMALKAILNEDANSLNQFPQIRDFVIGIDEVSIGLPETTKSFKNLDAQIAGERFRSAAKTLFYSVLNGAQADKMRKVLSNAIGKPVSIAAGDAMFSKFWSLYKGIKSYIDEVLEYAENHAINFGGIEFNITELPDGTKLMYSRKNGELAVTNLIACQWSRAEASAVKKIMQAVNSELPKHYKVELINQVHDEVGVTCKAEYWQEVYQFLSDEFAKQYDIYLQGFIPCDEPTEFKLLTKTHQYIPVMALNADLQPNLDDKGLPKIINLQPTTIGYSAKVGSVVTSSTIDKKGEVKNKEVLITTENFGHYWASPSDPYVPRSWADK